MHRSMMSRIGLMGGAGYVLAAILALATPRVAVGQNAPPSSAFPGAPGELAYARDTVDVPAIRRHVWDIFAMITPAKRDGVPWWRTWRLACTAFHNCPNSEGFQFPSELLYSLMHSTGTGEVILPQQATIADFPSEIIYFNDAAFEHVTREFHYETGDRSIPPCLTPLEFSLASRSFGTSVRGLNGQLNQCTKPGDLPNGIADRTIPEFPASAIALKTAWQVMAKGKLSKLTVWDMDSGTPSHEIRITADSASPQGGKACPNIDASRPVPLDCFYHFQLGKAAHILRSQPLLRDVEETDYAVLVGMHFMTKELPDWTWATFWWDDHPEAGRFASQRTASVSGVWRNYLMNSTFSQTTPRAADGTNNICFNPYLEGKLQDGAKTSCVRCHRMAAQQLPQTEVISPARPVSASDVYFASGIKTDYLWSLVLEPNALLQLLKTH